MNATETPARRWSIRYLWALRVPLIAATFVVALPFVAFSEAMHPYLSGLFDPLTPHALILVTALALFNVWTCVLMGALILTYGTDRLGLPPLTRKYLPIKWRYWPITAMLIAPILWRTIWYMATASGHGVGETMFFAGIGAVIAAVMLVFAWWIGERFDHEGGSARDRVKATWLGGCYQGVLGFLEKHPALGGGFVGKDKSNRLVLLEGHGLAFGLACSSVMLYVGTGYITRDVQRPELASTLAYVLLLLLVLTWLIGFLAFLCDRGRVPLIVIAGIWILFVNLVLHHAFSTDHIYRTVEPGAATPLIAPEQLLVPDQPTIVVAASGGGIQAAGWTAQTLNAMRAEPGFAEHLRLVSAVSGGSVGTMYALAAIPGCGPQVAEDSGAVAAFDANKAAEESSLHAVGWGLVFKDLPRSIAPFFSNPYVDRGSVLEDAWKREPRLRRMFPDTAPYLASWRPTRDGRECPGVIFNAMTAFTGEPMLFSTVGLPNALSGFDFYRRYPGRDIPLTTAVRLSATFPYVSPASRADVDDERRGYTHVVDGGYFDNYGVSSLAAVMHTALGALPASTTKRRVLVVEICDSPICSGDPAPDGPSMGDVDRGWPYQIIAPLSAFMAMRSSAQRVTNRTTLRLLKDYWRSRGTCIESLVVPFNNGNAPMSWHLTAREKQQIRDGWNKIAAEKLGAVRSFLAGNAATPEGAACLAGRAAQETEEGQRDATSIAKEALAEVGEQTVCDAVIVPADRSSGKQVLASVDASGRRFCNGVLRITATGRPTILQTIDAWQVERVADVVADLDKDGTNELVIPTAISDYQGAKCIAVVPVVYACTSGQCAVARNRFQDFYARKASELALRVAGANAESAGCLTMARDKLLRLSGSNPRAGFEAASAWMRDPNPSLRRKAVRVFADIADEPSRARLRVLAADRDPFVSSSAAQALGTR